MGLFDRLRGRDDTEDPREDQALRDEGVEEADEPVDSITSRAPTPEEEATLDAARRHYAARGIDPSDLASIAAAYEAALAEAEVAGDAHECVSVVSTAIGDHLVGQGYRWVVSTDPFGTDLAVEPPRRPVPVVVGTLVAVRWMQRDSGWVEPVVGHLARAGSR
jgi:hypothetical protein